MTNVFCRVPVACSSYNGSYWDNKTLLVSHWSQAYSANWSNMYGKQEWCGTDAVLISVYEHDGTCLLGSFSSMRWRPACKHYNWSNATNEPKHVTVNACQCVKASSCQPFCLQMNLKSEISEFSVEQAFVLKPCLCHLYTQCNINRSPAWLLNGSDMAPAPTIFVQAGTRIKLSWDSMSQLYSFMKYWRARLASLASKPLGSSSRQNSTISWRCSSSIVSVDFWPPRKPRVCLLLTLIGRSQEMRA